MLSSLPHFAPWPVKRPAAPTDWLKSDPTVTPYDVALLAYNYAGPAMLGPKYAISQVPVTLGANFQTIETQLFNATSITFNMSLPAGYVAPAMPLNNASTTQSNLTLPANYLETA